MQRAEGRAVEARCRHALFVEEIGVNGLDLVDLSRAHADAVVDHEAGERGAVDEHDRLPQEALSIFCSCRSRTGAELGQGRSTVIPAIRIEEENCGRFRGPP